MEIYSLWVCFQVSGAMQTAEGEMSSTILCSYKLASLASYGPRYNGDMHPMKITSNALIDLKRF